MQSCVFIANDSNIFSGPKESKVEKVLFIQGLGDLVVGEGARVELFVDMNNVMK
jgi:hypothetical protein